MPWLPEGLRWIIIIHPSYHQDVHLVILRCFGDHDARLRCLGLDRSFVSTFIGWPFVGRHLSPYPTLLGESPSLGSISNLRLPSISWLLHQRNHLSCHHSNLLYYRSNILEARVIKQSSHPSSKSIGSSAEPSSSITLATETNIPIFKQRTSSYRSKEQP